MSKATLARVRFTTGTMVGATAIQETDEHGELVALYSDDEEAQALDLGNCEWTAVQVLGQYKPGDTDGYWSLVGAA